VAAGTLEDEFEVKARLDYAAGSVSGTTSP
jgi:hypothetical protein